MYGRPSVFVDPTGNWMMEPPESWNPDYYQPYHGHPPTPTPTCKEIFDKWKLDNPVNPTWDDKLPPCPCSLWATRIFCDASGGFYSVKDQYVPKGWEDDWGCRGLTGMACNWYEGLSPRSHPGASHCIRSKFTTGQPSQQCC